eukprot:6029531-Pleurochrysis_carterae.AAC.1
MRSAIVPSPSVSSFVFVVGCGFASSCGGEGALTSSSILSSNSLASVVSSCGGAVGGVASGIGGVAVGAGGVGFVRSVLGMTIR